MFLARPTLVDSKSNKLHYPPFMVSLDGCHGSCNTLDDFSNRICAPNKTKDVNLSVANMVTE